MPKKDKQIVKSLLLSPSRVKWAPVDYSQSSVDNFSKGYSYKDLQKMAKQLGLDPGLSKSNLAISIATETLIFFPEEVGRYGFDSLVVFVNKFGLNAKGDDLYHSTKGHLQKRLIDAWKGGNSSDMQLHMKEVFELQEIMAELEHQYCSSKVRHLLRTGSSSRPSLYDQVQAFMKNVTEHHRAWNASFDDKEKRKHFVAAQAAIHKVQTSVVEYLQIIRKHCHGKESGVCDVKHMPREIQDWFKSAPGAEKVVMCNVTVEGKSVTIKKGDYLIPSYKVAMTIEHPETKVTWIGLTTDQGPENKVPVNRGEREDDLAKEIFTQGKPIANFIHLPSPATPFSPPAHLEAPTPRKPVEIGKWMHDALGLGNTWQEYLQSAKISRPEMFLDLATEQRPTDFEKPSISFANAVKQLQTGD